MTTTKLTTAERKALAIIGDRLPICDLGKDRFRSIACDLERSRPDLVTFEMPYWKLTDLGRANMGRAGKGSRWVKWAAEHGDADEMIAALNTGGTDAGHEILKRYRTN